MGRKKGSKNKSTKRKAKSNVDVAVVTLLVVSVLLFILIYAEKGAIGKVLSPMLGGMIGFIKYLIPIGTFALALTVARDDKNYVFSKVIQYLVVLSCIAAVLSIYQISTKRIDVSQDFSQVLEAAYDLGVKNIGGGTIGTVIAFPLIKLLGEFGAAIASTGIVLILGVFTFGLHPSDFLAEFIETADQRKAERAEEILARREERLARRNMVQQQNDQTPNYSVGAGGITKIKNGKIIREMPEITEEQISINNLYEEPKKEVKAETQGLFGGMFKKQTPEMDPEHIDSNIFKNTAKAQEEAAKKAQEQPPVQTEIASNDELFAEVEQEKEDKTKYGLQLDHAITVEDENYEYPPIGLLQQNRAKALKGGAKALTESATKLQKTLYSFGVSAKVENITVGPAITRYELKPAEGVRVNKIANLADDIALNLAAETIRIEAPIPGKMAVGIEIPNEEKQMVPLRDVLESQEFEEASSKKLSVALGKDVAGKPIIADISKMPHVLIAGATGSGKSVCINTIITSFIYNAKPSEVKLVMVDPKVVELSVYNGIPHLLIPVVTDPKKASAALAWSVTEMDKRYNLFAKKGVRDLKGYNQAVERDNIEGEGKLPQIVIIIDELADLMMVAAKEVEESICRLAQKARAAGMHLVIATQRPSVDVITGLIKANIPSRIAFAVSSQIDSRTILDQVGAEKLLGKGDMLYFPVGATKPLRVQGAFVSDDEVEKIVDFVKSNGVATYNEDILEEIENATKSDGEKDMEPDDGDDTDPLLMDAIETVVEVGTASTSFIQRKFKVGYARAGRIIDQMEQRGIISGFEGSKPRRVLITMERLNELKMSTGPVEEGTE